MLDCAEKAWAWRSSRGTVLEAVIESDHLMSTRLILTTPGSLPPFPDLILDPTGLWP